MIRAANHGMGSEHAPPLGHLEHALHAFAEGQHLRARRARRSCRGRALPSTARAIASPTSPAKTGWKRVLPPPISGRAGDSRAIAAKRLKKSSSGPNTIDGRMITASGTASRMPASPSALERR